MSNPILTSKELASILNVNISTAKRYMSDMMIHYQPPSGKLTMAHYKHYFVIPEKK